MSPLLPFLIGTLSIASIILAAPTPSAHHYGWYYPRYQPGQPYISQSHVNVNVPGLVNFNGQKVYTVPSTVGLNQQQRWNPSNGLFTRVLPTPQCVPCVQKGARNPLLFPSVQLQTNSNDLFNWLFNMTNNPFGFLQPTITRCCPITTTPRTTTTSTTTTTPSTPMKKTATVDTSLSNRLLLTKPMLPCLQCSSSISLNINGQQVLPAQSSVNVETLLALLGLTCCPTATTTVGPTVTTTTTMAPTTTSAMPTTAVPTASTTTVAPTTGAGRLFFNNLPCIQCSQDETSGRNPDLALFNLLFSNRPLGFICCPRTTTAIPTTITSTTVTPTTSTTTTVSTTVTAPPTSISTTTTTPTVSTTVTAPPTSISTTTIPTEPPTIPTEPPTVPTEPPTVPTESPTVPTEPPTVPTEPPTVPTEPPTVPTEPPTVPTEPPTVPTEPPTVPTESPTVPTEPPTVPTEPPTVPTEPPTVPTEPPTVPTEPPTVPTESPTVPTEPPTVPTEPPTVPTEPPTVPTESPTVPTDPTSGPIIPTLPPIFKQRTFSSDSNNGDSLPTDAIPLTGLRLLMNLFPPSSISFYRR